jgi:hypothetical protein
MRVIALKLLAYGQTILKTAITDETVEKSQ